MSPKKDLSTLYYITIISIISLISIIALSSPPYPSPTILFHPEQASDTPLLEAPSSGTGLIISDNIHVSESPNYEYDSNFTQNIPPSSTTSSSTTSSTDTGTSTQTSSVESVKKEEVNTTDAALPGETTHINQATLEALMKVSGIGEKKAADILDYLADTGGISNMDSLLNVSGIGDKTLQKLKLHFHAD